MLNILEYLTVPEAYSRLHLFSSDVQMFPRSLMVTYFVGSAAGGAVFSYLVMDFQEILYCALRTRGHRLPVTSIPTMLGGESGTAEAVKISLSIDKRTHTKKQG